MQEVTDILVEYIKENQNKLYRIAFSYTKEEESALDIVQESIEKALKNIHQLKTTEYIKTWFYRILINESLQYVKKNKKLIMYSIDDLEKDIYWEEDIQKDDIDIYKCVQKLNDKLKTVIILRFFEDMKIEEIAKVTNTNVNTVKSRLYKALEELKKTVGK